MNGFLKNYKILPIISFLLALGCSQLISAPFKTFAEDKPIPPEKVDHGQPEVMCYSRVLPEDMEKIQTREDLNKQLELLETQYKEKKIDIKTYKQSKENILKQIENLNK